jgi:hypothetical protein
MAVSNQEKAWPWPYEPSNADAAVMFRFLLAIITIEDAIGLALKRYWRSPRPDFYKKFIQDMPASRRLEQIEAIYPDFGVQVGKIKRLYDVRNRLAHVLPEAIFENDGEPVVSGSGLVLQPVRPVGRVTVRARKTGAVVEVYPVENLEGLTLQCHALRREVEGLKSPTPRRSA